LIPDILYVGSGNFFTPDTSIFGRSTEPASLNLMKFISISNPQAEHRRDLQRLKPAPSCGADGIAEAMP
jgi:hypothetical protein